MPGCRRQCARSGAGNRRWPKQCAPIFFSAWPEKKTGRTRKGYAASVSGKAANGCAVDGPKEKIATADRSAQSAYLHAAGERKLDFSRFGFIKRGALGETFGLGKLRIPLCSLSAGAALAVTDGGRGPTRASAPTGWYEKQPVCPPGRRVPVTPVGADAHIRPFPAPIHHQAKRKRI